MTALEGELGGYGPVRDRRGGVRGTPTTTTGRASAADAGTTSTTRWGSTTSLGEEHVCREDRDLGIATGKEIHTMAGHTRTMPLGTGPENMALDAGATAPRSEAEWTSLKSPWTPCEISSEGAADRGRPAE